MGKKKKKKKAKLVQKPDDQQSQKMEPSNVSINVRATMLEAKAKPRGLAWFKQWSWKQTLVRIFFVIFILTSAWDFISSVTHFVQAKRTKTWSETTGEVISSTIRTWEESSGDNSSTTYYSPELKYRYTANGKSYEGDHISYNIQEYSSRDAASRVVAQINASQNVNREIPVFYNPGDPQQSVLVRGVAGSDAAYGRMSMYFVFLASIATSLGLFLAAQGGRTGMKFFERRPGIVLIVMLVLGSIVVAVYEPGIDQDAIPKEWTTDDVSSEASSPTNDTAEE